MNKLLRIGCVMLWLFSLLSGTLFAGAFPVLADPMRRMTNGPVANLYCQLYLQDLAGRLNISVSALEQYKLAAEEDVLARLVNDHKMTRPQAELMKAKLAANAASARCD